MARILLLLALGCLSACADRALSERRFMLGTDGASQSTDGAGTDDLSCGLITGQGCCFEQTLIYCASGSLVTKPCAPSSKCGWNDLFSLYNCGPSDNDDPTGEVPRSCPDLDLGVPDAPAVLDASVPDGGECGALSHVGCCSGWMLYFCSGGKVLSLDCSTNPYCGWNSVLKFYDCGTKGTVDPSGTFPRPCSLVIGDGGVRLDGGPDLVEDQGPWDLSAEAVNDGAWDVASASDGFTTLEGPSGGDLVAPEDAGAEAAVGLDASGLDVSLGDSSEMLALGGGGCAGCSAGTDRCPASSVLIGLLILVLITRIRGKGDHGP